jgi:hypothetical protein
MMPMRYMGIRLLLVFVATNAAMILMLVSSMGSERPWLAYIMPGEFQSGGNNSGYYVFFSLWLLVDAVTSVGVALLMLVPALGKVTAVNLRYIGQLMRGRENIPDSARDAVLDAVRGEAASVRLELLWGKIVLLVGAFFLVLAFSTMTFSFTRALPHSRMFTRQCVAGQIACIPAGPGQIVDNRKVRGRDVTLFTVEQVAGAVLLDIPEIYGWHIGSLASNTANYLFDHFIFVFRTLFGFEILMLLFSAAARRSFDRNEE